LSDIWYEISRGASSLARGRIWRELIFSSVSSQFRSTSTRAALRSLEAASYWLLATSTNY